MAYVGSSSEKKGSRKSAADPATQRKAIQAKPGATDGEQFKQLYKSVTRRISKTLAILAK